MDEKYFQINNCRIRTRSTGNAEDTIIFVHGSSLSSQIWDDQLADAAFRDYRLITFDFPGHGMSDRSAEPRTQYTLKGLAATLVGVISSFDLDRYIIIGLSLGTSIIAEAAPLLRRCKGIILTSPVIVNNQLSPEKFLIPSPFAHVFTSAYPSGDELTGFVGVVLGNLPLHFHCLAIELFQQADPNYRAMLGESLAKKEWSDQIEYLRSTGIPLLIIQGKNEPLIKIGYLNDIQWQLWRNKIHLVENAGHMVSWDQPALFTQLVLEYAQEAINGFN